MIQSSRAQQNETGIEEPEKNLTKLGRQGKCKFNDILAVIPNPAPRPLNPHYVLTIKQNVKT